HSRRARHHGRPGADSYRLARAMLRFDADGSGAGGQDMAKRTRDHLPSWACNCGPQATAAARPALSRRDLLASGAAALAVGALAGSAPPGFGQERPRCIDVHHHIAPPSWLDAIKSLKRDNAPIANWSVQKTLDDMDKGGVATAITSPTTPQVNGLD